ncbi:MAG: glycoside hydrolase family 3 C-terminal domain-containing protein [Oscillospiraceae bacterium]|nr:glycoside hydrolase family 3 C-terminal domain-containing protein [Oscillospiraceae bacterium]
MNVQETLKQMTLEEKCAFLSGYTTWESRSFSRLGIPSFFMSDGPHGIRKQMGASDHLGLNASVPATCFPTAAAMANTWDEKLGEEMGEALGEEAVGQQVSILLGPGLNMKRDPLCGRNFEYFSEDPYLAGKMAASYVRGIQKKGGSACPKHFAVNSQETRRMASDSVLDERTLREIYLTGFEIVVKEAKPKCIMTSYNLVNGVYANENAHLLMDCLRKDWGYQGMIVTDWGGSNDHALGVKNGSSLEMPAPGLGSQRELLAAIKSGKISEKDVDDRCLELLNLIDSTHEAVEKKHTYSEEAHHALAERCAGEAVVLLKNEGDILPLAPNTKVALIGDFAETPRYQGSGSSVVNSTKVDTLKERIADSGLDCVGFAKGFIRIGTPDEGLKNEAVELAKKADVVLLCMGLNESNESEGAERVHMRIEDNQIEVLKAVAAVNKNVVVLFFSGSTVEVPWIDQAKAFVYASLGGQAGSGALLKILEGKLNPSGKLAETWPLTYEDTPAQGFPSQTKYSEYREGLYIGYRYYGTAHKAVRFPFGFGMSYTKFQYSDLKVEGKKVTFSLSNVGPRDGTEVCQIYVAKPDSKIIRPEQELKGFKRVELKAGETRTVTVELDDKAFRYFNVKTDKWEEEPGTYEIRVAASYADVRLTGTVAIEGTKAPAPYDEKALPHYKTADIKAVPDEEFAALLGRPVPEKNAGVPIDRNLIFGELNHSRSIIGWIVWFVLNFLKTSGEKAGKADLNVLFIYNMPLRALPKMAGGIMDMTVVDMLVLHFKGWWIPGFIVFLVSLFTPIPTWLGILLWFCPLLLTVGALIKNLIQNAIGENQLKSLGNK